MAIVTCIVLTPIPTLFIRERYFNDVNAHLISHEKLLSYLSRVKCFFSSWHGEQARVLREFSPEDVTENIYTMVDVLVHHIQMELQHGHPLQVYSLCWVFFFFQISMYINAYYVVHSVFYVVFHFQDLLLKACANLAFFVWTHECLPLDILLLALIDRDDDPHALRLVVCTS